MSIVSYMRVSITLSKIVEESLETDRQTDIHRQTDRQTDRQTESTYTLVYLYMIIILPYKTYKPVVIFFLLHTLRLSNYNKTLSNTKVVQSLQTTTAFN